MKKIFESTKIGKLELKNRFWRSATWLNLASEDSKVTPAITERYKELAEGGVGTIITGLTRVMEEDKPYEGMLGIYSDEFIEQYKVFTDMIHSYKANIIMQLAYGGSTTSRDIKGRTIWGPSAVPNPTNQVTPLEMSKENIKTIISAMGKAAKRAKLSGFDGVQIHGAHAYLFSQFLTPYFNRREDEYGGCIENISRIIFEVLEEIKNVCGEDYPVFIKMHCDDQWGDNGLTNDESLWVAKELEKKGINGIEFSGGQVGSKDKGAARTKLFKREEQAYFRKETSRIAEELNIPVISVGGHRNIEFMEEILNSTKISYFSLSRTLHSEPDLVNKWMDNPDKKPKCVSCNNCWTSEGNVCILNR